MRVVIITLAILLFLNTNSAFAKQVITKDYLQHIVDIINEAAAHNDKHMLVKVMDNIIDEHETIRIETQASGVGSLSIPHQQVIGKSDLLKTTKENIDRVQDYKYKAQLTGASIQPGKQSAAFSTMTQESGVIKAEAGGKTVSVKFKGVHSCTYEASIKQASLKIVEVDCKGTSEVMPDNLDQLAGGLK